MLIEWPIFAVECVLIGGLAGFVYGVFGSGAGLILVPGFYYILRQFPEVEAYQMQAAIGTAAMGAMLLGLSAAYMQWRSGYVKAVIVKIMLPGLVVGSLVAIGLLNIISSGGVKHLFSVLIIAVAFWFWSYDQQSDKTKWSLTSSYHHFLTFLQGLWWFLLGVPVFTVPYLCKCGIRLRLAIGCSTFLGLLLSSMGVVLLITTGIFQLRHVYIHGQLGFVNIYIVAFSLIPSAVMAAVGVKIGAKLPKVYLQKVYAILVFVVGVLMFF
ncbi:sulfite exporter TauE/SafE family protein [uncultured Shewanella sp.]|uniref:sulfite exporter TauE/SafE family protein n=1 Tax=uncultured Shewanella sp. TaxID=173975 RepID=UPI00261F80F4|nr:sulfite exporter TauE/SafE family protein [uncultured Shewanella sp.]